MNNNAFVVNNLRVYFELIDVIGLYVCVCYVLSLFVYAYVCAWDFLYVPQQ